METTDRQDTHGQQRRETHRVLGDNLVGKVKELLHEGNVRRIIIRDDHDRKLIEVPLGLGLGVAVLAPVWAALGAVAALVTDCSVEVVRIENDETEKAEEEPAASTAHAGWQADEP
jgi:hypothetical protein